MSAEPYALRLVPILKEKVWGGRRLAAYGKQLPGEAMVGESWELSDLAHTAVSGGGGGEARSPIAQGALAGRTVHDALDAWRERLLGAAPSVESFPLLVKYLDANQHLSVQVHPTPGYAAAHPDAALKSESWYVLEANEGSVIYAGLQEGVEPPDVAAAARDGTVASLLHTVPAVPGECHHVPSGTVHALGAGVLVAEVQTPSDTTFRIYDWKNEYGRTGRPLQLDAALESMRTGPAPPPTRLAPTDAMGRLVETEHFWIWQLRPDGARIEERSSDPSWRVVMVVAGVVEVATPRGAEPVRLRKGDTALIPAAIVGGSSLSATESSDVLYLGFGAQPELELRG